MENLNFYTVPLDYVEYLQKAELHKRGFTRVPNLEYGKERNQKFLCGIVLRINEMDYYVPVSSYKIQKADNFLICEKDGHAVSSLRFNYMFPVPRNLVKVRRIFLEPDEKYRALLTMELRYCIRNHDEIRRLAQRTYRRVLQAKNPGLVHNSCDFLLLEEKCRSYTMEKSKEKVMSKETEWER